MRHGSLFSGIGGFDLAAEWMGWENVFHCEWNPFGQKILHHYWPDAEQFNDITKTDFKKYHGTIDVISGGFPCQPYSSAGKRKGKEDERHLWPEMLRAIREIKPQWVVGENVRGLVNWNGGLVFDEVQLDLEAEGYEVQPFLLPAAGLNAPHRRDRIWFVAHSNGSNDRRESGEDESKSGEERVQERNEVRQSIEPSQVRDASNSNGRGWNEGNQCQHDDIREREVCSDQPNDGNEIRCELRTSSCDGNASNPDGIRLQQRENSAEMGGGQSEVQREGNQPTNAIKTNGEIANASNSDLQRSEWRGKCGEFEETRKGGNELLSELGNVENKWEQFPTKPPICGGDDGLPRELDNITFSKWRNESIKAYGNAIVPQVALQIFKAISQYEAKEV